MKLKSLTLSLGVAVLLCMSSAFAQTYNFTTINYPDDTFTQLLGINDSNDIAGYHGTTNKGFTYVLATKTFTSENYPGSAQTQVIGINDPPFKTSGFYITTGGKTIGFTDYLGTFTSVAYPGKPFNQLLSQNDFGQAAGYYSTTVSGSGPDTPYVYDEVGGVFESFDIPGSVSAQATGINNASDVCGFYVDNGGVSHGWLLVQGNSPSSTTRVRRNFARGIERQVCGWFLERHFWQHPRLRVQHCQRQIHCGRRSGRDQRDSRERDQRQGRPGWLLRSGSLQRRSLPRICRDRRVTFNNKR